MDRLDSMDAANVVKVLRAFLTNDNREISGRAFNAWKLKRLPADYNTAAFVLAGTPSGASVGKCEHMPVNTVQRSPECFCMY